MGLNLLRSMIMMTAMGGKNTLKNTALEEERRRRKKESKSLFWGRRRNSRTYKLRPAIKPLLLLAAERSEPKTARRSLPESPAQGMAWRDCRRHAWHVDRERPLAWS